ncbi:hypothetical protein [Massilia pseudoviolaceinigra]|uniref:hypothetical protein n=1 Tax=Massilia pseudoviolaceinigra TaxID=3057165 RepID=UPI0027968A61|nr:hypothetical protein [Massilia sp. CCM 9206]MDQ1920234.1 hypothetical protein [Massilia sp. CCM 9206]
MFFFNVAWELPNEGGRVSTPLIDVGADLHAVQFFVSENNGDLRRPFGGTSWMGALKMVINMPKADGMIIQGDDSAWIAVDKNTIRNLLSKLQSA